MAPARRDAESAGGGAAAARPPTVPAEEVELRCRRVGHPIALIVSCSYRCLFAHRRVHHQVGRLQILIRMTIVRARRKIRRAVADERRPVRYGPLQNSDTILLAWPPLSSPASRMTVTLSVIDEDKLVLRACPAGFRKASRTAVAEIAASTSPPLSVTRTSPDLKSFIESHGTRCVSADFPAQHREKLL